MGFIGAIGFMGDMGFIGFIGACVELNGDRSHAQDAATTS